MHRALLLLAMVTTAALSASAQWQIQASNTTADLRGIHSLGNGIVWASGTSGTILHTTDGGAHWLPCAVPPDAEKLDFRGIQALDANTAIVMSSGKGDLSRLYKTTDACHTWKLLFTNPDKEGFWDSVTYVKDSGITFILGDPVDGEFRLFSQRHPDGPFSANWNDHPIAAVNGQAAFAASNSLLISNYGDGMFSFITGGTRSEIVHEEHGMEEKKGLFSEWSRSTLPLPVGVNSGAFSIAARPHQKSEGDHKFAVVVGGDYSKPDVSSQTAAFSEDWGYAWQLAQTPPHGYRSAVAYDAASKAWITVGPNGTDISIDDGKNWSALKPGKEDQPDADKNWNALSLPFVIGPHGRIGKLRANGLPH